MSEEFNMSMRKFLKQVGVTSQQAIENGLRDASPISVLNAQAATAAGVLPKIQDTNTNNPLAKFANNFKLAQAASQGDILTLASASGQPVQLCRSKEEATLAVGAVDFGSSSLYIGDLPGLAAMNGLGINAPPAAVLGMDILRKRPKMLFRGQQNELYF